MVLAIMRIALFQPEGCKGDRAIRFRVTCPAGNINPRVTRVGQILSLTGIDELPQLINVVLGEMSIVGRRNVGGWPRIPMLAGSLRRAGCVARLEQGPHSAMPQGQTSWAWRVRIVELSRWSGNPATELSNRAKKLFSRAKNPRSCLGVQFCAPAGTAAI
jgi:hypothetical protein